MIATSEPSLVSIVSFSDKLCVIVKCSLDSPMIFGLLERYVP
jgi:hypothetical protein